MLILHQPFFSWFIHSSYRIFNIRLLLIPHVYILRLPFFLVHSHSLLQHHSSFNITPFRITMSFAPFHWFLGIAICSITAIGCEAQMPNFPAQTRRDLLRLTPRGRMTRRSGVQDTQISFLRTLQYHVTPYTIRSQKTSLEFLIFHIVFLENLLPEFRNFQKNAPVQRGTPLSLTLNTIVVSYKIAFSARVGKS